MTDSSGEQHKPHKVGARLNIASSASEKADCPDEVIIATTPQEEQGPDTYCPTSATLKVTLLGSEWNSSAGGLSTLNRELAIHLSKHPKVEVSFLVPEGACKYEEKRAAQNCGVTVVDAKKRPGYDPLDWLSFPPPDLSMDIVVGHGVKLGRQGQVIRDSSRFHSCKWVQVVHTAPEDLSKYKSYADPISKGERKHQDEVDLCKLADLVVPVGPRLEEFYSSYLRRCKKDQDVFSVTPGLFDREFGDLEQAPNKNADFKVLIFGRGDDEDFELKGYNLAAEAFTDHRLKKKPYHLIFVGAPDGKQEEVRQKLLRFCIAEEQLTVRKFIQSRDRMKDLLCEADLAIMPSKSEGFGLVALEALSAGLPILVGSKSGFAKALENVPFGKSCIVDSDDPTKWAEAIEAVRVRHVMRLEEIKGLRASYEMKYSWKEQCEALVERMWRIVQYGLQDLVEEQSSAVSPESVNSPCSNQQSRLNDEVGALTLSKKSRKRSRSLPESLSDSGPSQGSLKTPRVEYSAEQQLPSEKGPRPEKRASGTNEELKGSFSSKDSLQIWSKPSVLESTAHTGTINAVMRLLFATQTLSDEQQEIVDEMLTRQIQVYTKHHKLSTPDGVGALIEYIINAHGLALQSVGIGSLVIEVQCLTLKGLESLWNDYCSGHLNEVAERYLVTDEIKRKLNLETVRLKTTIEEKSYLVCKKALMEKTPRHTEPDQGEDTTQTDTRSDYLKDKKQDLNWMAKAKKAKASRGALHKASISGQYETVEMLLESGEDVNQADQFSLTPLHLACWYGHESVVKLLLERGANIDASDKFQRTPLQKAERHNHKSIVQLLLKSNANPSYQQPLSLKSLAQKAFLHVDRRSGFNLLQAAVLEGNYIILWKADTLLDNFVNRMNFETTGNNAELFSGKTAVDILSSLEKKEPGHAVIDTLYKRMINIFNMFTDLHWCTCGDDVEQVVELVLNDGVDVDIPAFRNCTPLLWASMSSSSTFIKTLIDLGANVNAQRTNDKATPLTLAADLNHYMATRILLEHEADANIQNIKGNTPLHVSVRKGFLKLSQLLIEKGCDINLRNKSGRTPLHDAAIKKHENVFKLLLTNNADVNIQDMNGDAPLHWSVLGGLFKGSQLLINAGSNINLRNKKGRTPVYIAVDNKLEQLIKLLLESNADVSMRYKQDPKDRVYVVRAKDKGKLAWHHVMVEKHLLGLFLKLMNGGSFNVADFGAVLQSCSGKKLPKDFKVKVLKITDGMFDEIQGDTLLHVASTNNSSEVIDLLVKYGADINAQNEDGFTPLHMAAIHGNMQVVEKLVDLGADVSLATADGKNAANLAHLNEETEIEEYLKAKMSSTQ